MSSITIHLRKKNTAPCKCADAGRAHPACHECLVDKCGRNFGWKSDATRKPSRRSAYQRQEGLAELDERPRAKHLPDGKRFSQQRQAIRGVISAHTNLSTLRQRRSAELRRARREPASGGNAAGDSRCRPLTGARRVSAGRSGGLRHTRTPLHAGCRLLGEPCEPADGLQKGPKAVVSLPASRSRSVVPPYARCTQRVRNRKTQEVRCMTEDVVCRFEFSRGVPNVPATGKEGTDD